MTSSLPSFPPPLRQQRESHEATSRTGAVPLSLAVKGAVA
jgi:hypothetical protein